MRIALGIEYDGSPFYGWQRQEGQDSVQSQLEAALSQVADEPIIVFCAGRTDRGVHALEQVVHFDTGAQRPEHAWLLGGNALLPKSIRIKWVKPVANDFHARFSAQYRRYCYVIANTEVPPALYHQQATWFRQPLDVELMHQAAQQLLGEHDFAAFRAAACQAKHGIRTLQHINLRRRGELILLDIQANGFLHHMVRNITGSLLKVGIKEQPVGWIADLLVGQDRTQASITAPPNGLYFSQVGYDPSFELPQVVKKPFFF